MCELLLNVLIFFSYSQVWDFILILFSDLFSIAFPQVPENKSEINLN